MTLHAPTDVRSISIPTDRGGCGEPHKLAGDPAEGEHLTVDCGPCEAVISTMGHGWAADPLQVALTPDERARFDALSDQAKTRQASTWADPQAIGNAVAQALATAGGQGSLLDQIRAMPDEHRAMLAALLQVPAPVAPAGGGTAPDTDPAAEATPSADAALAKPTKRAAAKKTTTPATTPAAG
jgi:hypothetical protein